MSMVRLAALAAVTALTLSPTASSAAELGAGFSISGGAALVSDYRFRGVSLSGQDPAVQATATIGHESGFYAGTWASSIDGGDLYGHTEIDLYGGWSGEMLPGTTLDTMVAYYAYPNGDDSFGPADYFEGTAKLSHVFGPVTATGGVSYSWEQKALGGRDNLYLFSDLAAAVPGTPFTVKGHVGRTEGALALDGHYLDWSLGADAALEPVTLGLAYVDSDIASRHGVDAALVLSAGLAF
jgi:uncharacterized protein (TIGR02001 family)